MPTTTVENYVKQIYLEHQRLGDEFLPMKALAVAMDVSPGTATAMMKSLARSGLVDYEPWTGSRLTESGEALALHVLRRHRLIELFLVEMLGLDWSEVHDEADALEHAISDRVLERIDRFLGHPTVDPHGDPIPSQLGKIDDTEFDSLMDFDIGARLTVTRILDQDPDFLQFVERSGLQPGSEVRVRSRDRIAEAITVDNAAGVAVSLGSHAASKILATQDDDADGPVG